MELFDFMLPELSNLRASNGNLTFQEAYDMVTLNMSIRDAAKILGNVKKIIVDDFSREFLDLMHIFRDLETEIRFSIWPKGIKAPHHFSKCLLKQELISLFGEKNVLVLTAILGDPKGLNIRNIAAHGLVIDPSFSRPVVDGIRAIILPLLPKSVFPEINFSRDITLLHFHKDFLDLQSDVKGFDFAKSTPFPFIQGPREKLLFDAYKYFAENRFIDSLFLLFPIFEQSLRLFAVEKLHLPQQRKSADPNEQFLSIPECYDSLPQDLSRMINDIMFHPDGPRIRDRLMHEGIKEIPKELALLVFDMFERICSFSAGQCFGKWYFAFHPSRILEYYLFLLSGIRGFDTYPFYSSKTFARFIDCVKKAIDGKKAEFKDQKTTEYCQTSFPILASTITLHLLLQEEVNDKMFTHYTCFVGAPTKYANLHCSERFWDNSIKEIGYMSKIIPFITQKPSKEDILEYSNEKYLSSVIKQLIASSHC